MPALPHATVDTVPPRAIAAPRIRQYLPIGLVLAGYALAALIVPVMSPVAIGDDWVYVRSVEILLREGELRVLDLSVVTLLFQVAWGALFGLLFGLDFGTLRLSTVVMTLLGGWACYGIARELGVDRARSSLAAAAYLFNPLSFVMSYSFMTDPHFTALMAIASFGYVRGLQPAEVNRSALLLGAAAAACAFLVRQQGVLIPLAVIAALLLQGRLRWDRPSLALFLRVVGIPVVAFVLYYLWLWFVHGVPEQQTEFTARIVEAGAPATATLVARLAFIEAMYLGLFVLPIAVGATAALSRLAARARPAAWLVAAGWGVMLIAGILHFDSLGFDLPPMPRMPYLAQYLGPGGLGPGDWVGARPWLVSWQFLDVLTGLCAIASLLLAFVVARRLLDRRSPHSRHQSAVIVLLILGGQAAGVLPPSFHFQNWIISVDRYLLPLLPLALCLAVWAVQDVPWSRTAAWVVTAVLALISIAGTRDFLALQQTAWSVARSAYIDGASLTAIDGGAAWDGYYLYEYSIARNLDQQTPGGPWWTDLFGPATTSDYVVATAPLDGYTVVREVPVSSWLSGLETHVFLLHRTPPIVAP